MMHSIQTIVLALILSVTLVAGSYVQSVETQVETVNINTADAETLARVLDGVGEKKSAAIVDYRTQNGAFESLVDLNQVYGIGEKTLERNKNKIVFADPEEADSASEEAQPQSDTSTTALQKNDAQDQ